MDVADPLPGVTPPGEKEHANVRQRNIEFLQLAAKPQAVLLLMVAPSVELLVQATRTQ